MKGSAWGLAQWGVFEDTVQGLSHCSHGHPVRAQTFLQLGMGVGHMRVSAERMSATWVLGPSLRSGAHSLSLNCQLHVWLTFLPFQIFCVLMPSSPSACPSHPFLHRPEEWAPFHFQPPSRMTPISPQPSGEIAFPPHLCLRGNIRDLLLQSTCPLSSDVHPWGFRLPASQDLKTAVLLFIPFQWPFPSLSFLYS